MSINPSRTKSNASEPVECESSLSLAYLTELAHNSLEHKNAEGRLKKYILN